MKAKTRWQGFFIALLIIPFIRVSLIYADDGQWQRESAYLLTPGRLEKGIFQPLTYGFSSRLEITTYLLSNFVLPNVTLKCAHRDWFGWKLATVHAVAYPTPLLRLIAREGIGGIISPEFEIPRMLSLCNGLIISRRYGEQLISFKASLNLGLRCEKLDERTTIDLPLAYPRLMPFYHGYGLRTGFDYRRQVNRTLDVMIDSDVFIFPGSDNGFNWESKCLLQWHPSPRNQFSFGYKLVYGEYPFGNAWHLFIPIFDYQHAWQLK